MADLETVHDTFDHTGLTGVGGSGADITGNALYAFPPSDSRDALMFLPDYVISRDR